MSFSSFIFKQRRLLLFWFLFHSIGLFVNTFEIAGNFKTELSENKEISISIFQPTEFIKSYEGNKQSNF